MFKVGDRDESAFATVAARDVRSDMSILLLGDGIVEVKTLDDGFQVVLIDRDGREVVLILDREQSETLLEFMIEAMP